jgi:hypothetical protein
MRFKCNLVLASLFLLGTWIAPSFASDVVEKGRDVFNKTRLTVVTVEVVLKATGPGGRSGESKQDISGTVVDPSGLTVTALSACDPSEMYRRVSQEYKVQMEVSDIKILLDDGTELPAEIVLRDNDLDLAFIRPKAKPAGPMAAVDLSKSGTAQVLDEIVAVNRLNKAASRAYAASIEHIAAVIQKPRTFYIPDATMSATSLGCPAFLPDGRMLGIFVIRAVSSDGETASNYRQNLTSIILPADDILKGAKQAPEAKPDSEKKEEPKDTKTDGADKK